MDWQKLFFTYTGRINRKEYWTGVIAVLGIWIFSAVILMNVFGQHSETGHLLETLIELPLGYAWINIGIKRYHDRGKSGWFMGVWFVLLIGGIYAWIFLLFPLLWYLFECGFLPGTNGPNVYDWVEAKSTRSQ